MEGLFLAELENISGIFPREDWGIAIEITSRKALADFAKTLRELNMHIKSQPATSNSPSPTPSNQSAKQQTNPSPTSLKTNAAASRPLPLSQRTAPLSHTQPKH